MSAPVYLDHAATTPVAPEVRVAMLPFLGEVFGNPSSAHSTGRAARVAVDYGRERVAAALGCAASEVVFTSRGSEPDNLAIRGALDSHADRRRQIVVTAIEHDDVLKTADELASI